MATRTKTTIQEDRTAVYGFVEGNGASFAYRRSTPRSKKANELIIRVNGKRVTLGGPQINQLKRLFVKVG